MRSIFIIRYRKRDNRKVTQREIAAYDIPELDVLEMFC